MKAYLEKYLINNFMKVSIIIPAYNEEKVIKNCIASLLEQSYKNQEVIIIDDGSTDKTRDIIKKFPVKLYQQNHLGAGSARNLGAKHAKGEILVFVDADMIFDHNFVKNLTKPIIEKNEVGTFSKEEYVLNKDNIWSKCWNINKNLPVNRMHPLNYPDKQPVFRAILKKEFDRVGGFTSIGYIDDHTLAEKLGVMAKVAPNAVFYHLNPGSLGEIYRQARWIGKSEFKRRKVHNEFIMRLISLIRYSLPLSFINGIIKSIKFHLPQYLVFKFIYDIAIEISLLKSFLDEQKYR